MNILYDRPIILYDLFWKEKKTDLSSIWVSWYVEPCAKPAHSRNETQLKAFGMGLNIPVRLILL